MKTSLSAILFVCLTALACAAENPVSGDPLKGSGGVHRAVLTREALLSAAEPSSPVDDGAFSVPVDAAQPTELFEGEIHIARTAKNGYHQIVDIWDYRRLYPEFQHLPEIKIDFVQNGSHLIPVRQGLVITGSEAWNVIVGPGRVWREQADAGYMRAAFPFTLVERNQNCTHNGSMMFLFSATKQPNVSPVSFQVTEETCDYLRFDMWGKAQATYVPAAVPDAEQLRNAHVREVADRMPTKPLSTLAADYPGVDPENIARAYKHPECVGTYGVVVNGVNYNRGCPTRYGVYAFCADMRMASYSTAKSSFAGVSMLRLSQMYGKPVYDLLISEYVPEAKGVASWQGVTFKNTLDMATGNYINPWYMADEDGKAMAKFLIAESYPDKIHDALSLFPHAVPPGQKWVYQSSATFTVTQAMNNYLKQRQGAGADLFHMWVNDIAKPLKTSRGFWSTIRTDDSDAGGPAGYYGLFWTSDDVAKFTSMLNRGDGIVQGKQTLDREGLEASLFRTGGAVSLELSGVPLYGREALYPGSWRYNNAFWGKHVTRAEFGNDVKCDFWASMMFGYGGIVIALFPNGTSFYLFSDSNEVHWQEAMLELSKVAPMCKP